MLPDVVLGALHEALGDRVPAEGTSCLWNPILLGGHGIVSDEDFGDATPFALNMFHTGGAGARPNKDGLSATAFPSGVRNTPVEINESIAPIIVWRKEYRTDSGGAGEYRGGTGQVMEVSNAEGAYRITYVWTCVMSDSACSSADCASRWDTHPTASAARTTG